MPETAVTDGSRDAECVAVLVFHVANRMYGLRLSAVQRVVRAVAITELPDAPEAVLGVINVQGRVIPVFDLRRRFRLPRDEIAATDHMVIALANERPVAILVDSVAGVFEYPKRVVVRKEDLPLDLQYVRGMVKLENGMILIHDLDTFLSVDEEAALDRSLAPQAQDT